MVRAARSGKQSTAEGSIASGTSRKTELKLVGVARASFEELLPDFEDFLRRRDLPTGAKTTRESKPPEVWRGHGTGRIGPTGRTSRRAALKRLPTDWLALSTRPTTCSTSNCANSTAASSKRAE